MSNLEKNNNDLIQSIVALINNSRKQVAAAINQQLTLLYWNIGKEINDNILQNKRADYGKQVLNNLSIELNNLYGRGFSKRNLRNFMLFNELYPTKQIVHSLSAQLSWTHIRYLLTIKDNLKREFYIQMCRHERWSVRTLHERISSMLFERTAISKKNDWQSSTNLLYGIV